MTCHPCELDFKSVKKSIYDIYDICSFSAEFFNIPLSKLLGPCRKDELVEARGMIYKYLYEENYGSYNYISKVFSGRAHTTVLHGIRDINDWIDCYDETRELYKNYVESISNKIS